MLAVRAAGVRGPDLPQSAARLFRAGYRARPGHSPGGPRPPRTAWGSSSACWRAIYLTERPAF